MVLDFLNFFCLYFNLYNFIFLVISTNIMRLFLDIAEKSPHAEYLKNFKIKKIQVLKI